MIACDTLGSQHRLPGDHDSALLPGFFSFVLTAASHHPNTEVSLCLPTSASRMWSMVSLSHSPSQPHKKSGYRQGRPLSSLGHKAEAETPLTHVYPPCPLHT